MPGCGDGYPFEAAARGLFTKEPHARKWVSMKRDIGNVVGVVGIGAASSSFWPPALWLLAGHFSPDFQN